MLRFHATKRRYTLMSILGRIFLVAISLLAGVIISPGQTTGTSIYSDPKGIYSVAYPRTWYLDARAQGFRVYNFPPSKRVPQIVLPKYGAGITFPGHRSGSSTIEAWIEENNRRFPIESREKIKVSFSAESKPVEVVETVSHWKTGDVEFEYIDWYFNLNTVPFQANLFYYRGDAYRSELKEVFRQVVTSLQIMKSGKMEGS